MCEVVYDVIFPLFTDLPSPSKSKYRLEQVNAWTPYAPYTDL